MLAKAGLDAARRVKSVSWVAGRLLGALVKVSESRWLAPGYTPPDGVN